MDSELSLADMMVAYAEDAVAHAQSSFQTVLDYSPDSVRLVEGILEKLHTQMPRKLFGRLFKKGPPKQAVWTISKAYGGYLGEVVRRMAGGEWLYDTELLPGQRTICLALTRGRVFPPAKVFKRLNNGAEDDVWAYFQILMRDLK
jgi:hypothetical protein